MTYIFFSLVIPLEKDAYLLAIFVRSQSYYEQLFSSQLNVLFLSYRGYRQGLFINFAVSCCVRPFENNLMPDRHPVHHQAADDFAELLHAVRSR